MLLKEALAITLQLSLLNFKKIFQKKNVEFLKFLKLHFYKIENTFQNIQQHNYKH